MGCDPSTSPAANLDAGHNPAAFYRDPWGVVHLKGLVTLKGCEWIFQLLMGYRPAARSVFATVSNNTLGRINVGTADLGERDAGGIVQAEVGSNWMSLDGTSFRCAPRGEGGCPWDPPPETVPQGLPRLETTTRTGVRFGDVLLVRAMLL